MTAKQFHIGDIISIIHDRLFSLDHVGGLYNILGWMTDDELFTHQLPRASRECEPLLRQWFPDLAALELPEVSSLEEIRDWFDQLAAGGMVMWRDVPKLHPEDHARIDPVLELQHIVGTEKVIVVVSDGNND